MSDKNAPAHSDVFLGIDLGTTSIKAALINGEGNCLAQFGQSYPIHRPAADLAEQDPQDWTGLIDAALDGLHAQTGLKSVRAGALTSQVNSHLFVDKAGAPLMPAIIWQDTRAAAEAAELDARLSSEEKIALLGAPIPIDASHPLARMLWVKRHKPEIWARAAHMLLPKDYALFHLTGRIATDPLSNIGLVGEAGAYVEPILDLVPGAAERMAPISGLTEFVGEIARGPFKATPMVTATMDGWVGLLGGGAARQDAMVYLSGTSEILGASSPMVTNEPGVVVFAEAEGLRLHAGPTQSGGASQDWFCHLAGIDYEKMTELAATWDEVSGASTPLFLPQLAGERAPLWNADLRGAFLGITSGMSTAAFARAVYEGVAFSARHLFEALEASSGIETDMLTCGGGGFRNALWGQIRANCLGKRLKRLAVNEPGIIGAVCLAARAVGAYPNLSEAYAAFARFDQIWEPDHKLAAYYDERFAIYKEAIAANELIGKRLGEQKL